MFTFTGLTYFPPPARFLVIGLCIVVSPFASAQTETNYLRCFPDRQSGEWLCREISATGELNASRNNTEAPLSPFDWVPGDYLTPAQRAALGPGCRGAYIDPLAGTELTGQELAETSLVIEADESSMTGGNAAMLEGNVQVSHGNRSIAAEKMVYNRDLEEAVLEGGVTIRNPGVLIRGDRAQASTIANEASFEEAIFVLHNQHIRGSAESIRQTADNVIILEDGMITSCEPGSRAWSLEGGEIFIDNESKEGTGKNLKLRVGGVPIAYIPYISFPLGDERKSGFLFPSISSSDDGGLDIAVPYYWNLAPNYDATITPRFISGRGPMLETETRHLNRWLRTDLNLAYLADDEGGQDEDIQQLIDEGVLSESEARPHRGNNRWLIDFRQIGGTNQYFGWYSNAVYTEVSDVDYFRDLGNSSFSSINTTHLNQSLELGYLLKNWQFNVQARDSQVLLLDVNSPYQKLPQVTGNGVYNFGRFGLKLNNEYTRFDHPEDFWLNDLPVITGQRFASDYRVNWPTRASWGFFVPEAGYKYLAYELDDEALLNPEQSSPELGAGQASLDMGLVFEHRGGNFLQTFEPRIYYLYRDYVDHSALYNVAPGGQDVIFDTSIRTFSYDQLFRDSRFSGKDRLDDANQGTIGISSSWIDNATGRELFRLSVGQVFFESDQRVALSDNATQEQRSEIAGEFAADLGALGRFYTAGIYDSEADHINRASAGIRYADSEYRTLVNLSYSFVRDFQQVEAESKNIDQLDASAVAPINEQWALMARYNYDFTLKQELEMFLGLEYNDCCYRIRLLARKWLDSNIATLVENDDQRYDQGVFFEIHFKGLGGSGAKVNSILSDSIPGYQEREQLHYR